MSLVITKKEKKLHIIDIIDDLISKFSGVIAILWCIVWLAVVKETPQEDKYISEEELDYIRATVGPAANHVKVVKYQFSGAGNTILLSACINQKLTFQKHTTSTNFNL